MPNPLLHPHQVLLAVADRLELLKSHGQFTQIGLELLARAFSGRHGVVFLAQLFGETRHLDAELLGTLLGTAASRQSVIQLLTHHHQVAFQTVLVVRQVLHDDVDLRHVRRALRQFRLGVLTSFLRLTHTHTHTFYKS